MPESHRAFAVAAMTLSRCGGRVDRRAWSYYSDPKGTGGLLKKLRSSMATSATGPDAR
jgi:hypothetical protein